MWINEDIMFDLSKISSCVILRNIISIVVECKEFHFSKVGYVWPFPVTELSDIGFDFLSRTIRKIK